MLLLPPGRAKGVPTSSRAHRASRGRAHLAECKTGRRDLLQFAKVAGENPGDSSPWWDGTALAPPSGHLDWRFDMVTLGYLTLGLACFGALWTLVHTLDRV